MEINEDQPNEKAKSYFFRVRVKSLPLAFWQRQAEEWEVFIAERNGFRYALLGRRQWQPTPVLLPGKPMDGGAW